MSFSNFYPENRAVYEIMYKNMVEADYWMTLRKRENTRKSRTALCGEVSTEDVTDLS